MRKLMVFLAFLVASTISARTASASQIVQTQTFWDYTCQLCSLTATFNQFNPAHGNLLGMSVSISGEQWFSLSISPTPECDPYDYDCNPSVYSTFSVGYTLNGPGFPYLDPWSLDSFFAVINDAGVYYYLDDPGPPNYVFDYTTSTYDLNPYIGTGLVQLHIGESEDSDFCETDGYSICSQRSYVPMDVTLTYFTAAPEPTTIAMLGGGLIPLVSAKRKSLTRKREIVSTRCGK